jgi:hypothetical protein
LLQPEFKAANGSTMQMLSIIYHTGELHRSTSGHGQHHGPSPEYRKCKKYKGYKGYKKYKKYTNKKT